MDAGRMVAVTEVPKAAPVNIRVGSHVWVKDSNAAGSSEGVWVDAEVVEIPEQVIVKRVDRKFPATVDLVNVCPKDPRALRLGVEDMTELAYLHEPSVVQNLASRYKSDLIYTYIGSILVAINPSKNLPHLYNGEMMAKYKEATHKLSPHVYAVADAAYKAMMKEEKRSQSILVSGESGAGKTESTKRLMEYLAFMGGRAVPSEGRSVEDQVLKSIPVLEAFGNAKTVRNSNSSRFGKFVELEFDKDGKISGAAIQTYLLERSRVCQISDGERNYHCFYLLFGAPHEDIVKYKLEDESLFHYLNNEPQLHGVEAPEYHKTREAMEVVGIIPEEQDAIFRVLAAILHLGNVDFTQAKENVPSTPKDDKARFHLKTAAELFMCDVELLEDSLCKRVMVGPKESIVKSLDPAAAVTSRDVLAKLVYSRLFDWLVKRINESIDQDPDSNNKIGVLDMCGFESFKNKNSFEQFCINLANEKLQQQFNQHVFKMERDEYKREEVDWSEIECHNNQDVLDLIEKKPGGIIALLDEACMFPKSTHETFANKLYATFQRNKWFSKPKLSRTDFIIHHYGGDVTYETNFFLEKNKDFDVIEHQDLLSSSECTVVKKLFPAPSMEHEKCNQLFNSIGTCFKKQVQCLLDTLSLTNPHYIRCVKPNNNQELCNFENNNILQQLRCGGIIEAMRITRARYPIRLAFDEFLYRFGIHTLEALGVSYGKKATIKILLQKVGLQGYQMGKNKIFLMSGKMAELDALIHGSQTTALDIIQDAWKSSALQSEKVKLEKQVKELTYSILLDKSVKVEMEAQVRETNISLDKEREATKMARKKEVEFEKKYIESQKESVEFIRKAKEVESEVEKLRNEDIHRRTLLMSHIREISECVIAATQTIESVYHALEKPDT